MSGTILALTHDILTRGCLGGVAAGIVALSVSNHLIKQAFLLGFSAAVVASLESGGIGAKDINYGRVAIDCALICSAGVLPEIALQIGLNDRYRAAVADVLPGVRFILVAIAALAIGSKSFTGIF